MAAVWRWHPAQARALRIHKATNGTLTWLQNILHTQTQQSTCMTINTCLAWWTCLCGDLFLTTCNTSKSRRMYHVPCLVLSLFMAFPVGHNIYLQDINVGHVQHFEHDKARLRLAPGGGHAAHRPRGQHVMSIPRPCHTFWNEACALQLTWNSSIVTTDSSCLVATHKTETCFLLGLRAVSRTWQSFKFIPAQASAAPSLCVTRTFFRLLHGKSGPTSSFSSNIYSRQKSQAQRSAQNF